MPVSANEMAIAANHTAYGGKIRDRYDADYLRLMKTRRERVIWAPRVVAPLAKGPPFASHRACSARTGQQADTVTQACSRLHEFPATP